MPASATTERWDIGALPRGDRAEGWRQVITETHLPWRIDRARDDPAAFTARLRRERLGGLSLIDCRCDPSSGGRGRPELTATRDAYVGVLTVLRGREVLEQDGREVELRAGGLAIWDSERPARFAVREPLVKRTLLVPRDRFAAVCPRPERLTALPAARPAATALVHAHLGAVLRVAPGLDAGAASAAVTATLELVAAALEPAHPAPRSVLDAAFLASVDAYVERHLGDPSLRPERIARAHAISVRTLHALFARRGEPVCARVRRLRLARARAELERAPEASLTAVAFHWGFTDPAQFSRAFRRQYGESPREARARAVAG
jgi:AraC-like DNA-binding protein